MHHLARPLGMMSGVRADNLEMALRGSAHEGKPRIALLLAGGILAAAFAGCAAPGSSPEATVTISGNRCLAAAGASCKLGPDGILVRGLTIDGSSPNRVGLLVDGLTTRLVLEDVDIRGYDTGIEIGSTCPDCHVVFRNLRIEGVGVGILVGGRGGTEGSVHLRALEIEANDHAIKSVQAPGGLFVDGAMIRSPDVSNGRGIWALAEAGTLRASNMTIQGFSRAINGNWSAVVLRQVEIDCVFDAVYATNMPEFDADGLTIRNCTAGVPCEDPCVVYAVALAARSPLHVGGTVRIRNLNMTNYLGGIFFNPYRSVELEHFSLTQGRSGLEGVAGSLGMRDGVVSDHERFGVHVGVGALVANRVSFDHNGFGPARQGDRGGLYVYTDHVFVNVQGERLAPLEIHNSSFTRNAPFGLVARGDVFDASYNWWGHPLGPSPPTPAAAGNPATLGDMAAGDAVITEPHLSAPPAR